FTFKLALLILISLIFVVVSFIEVNPKGIIKLDRSYLMSAPSSGAQVVDIIQKGHRVNILGKQDIWYRIEWKGQELYIRASQMLAVPGLNDNRGNLF
ncbi:MAG: SH3 domain-containing protein, partial [Bacteroidota bacterium]